MEMKREKFGERMDVTFSGSMSVEYAQALKIGLVEALEGSRQVALHLEEVTESDLACLQLLCSAHRTAVAAGKSLVLPEPLPEVFQHLVQEAGVARRRGCTPERSESCLWRKGSKS